VTELSRERKRGYDPKGETVLVYIHDFKCVLFFPLALLWEQKPEVFATLKIKAAGVHFTE